MFRKLALFFAIIFAASTALADQKVVGHMTPLPHEGLANPVRLDCGLTITEMRGSRASIPAMNSMCTHAASNFFKFIDAKGLSPNHREPDFRWNLSLIPIGTCYRCLNDEQFRFKNRMMKGYLIGLTDQDNRYIFTSSRHHEFKTTFVHEVFHAMSMHYGVFDNHHEHDSYVRANTDEDLAQDFTEWLGYGR